MKAILRLLFLAVAISLLPSISQAQTDVVLAVDKSGTMKANDPQNLRFDGAEQFLTLLGLYRNNNQAGVVAFGNDTNTLLDFGYISSDKAKKYKDLLINQSFDDWTELGLGLKTSLNLLSQSSSRNKNIILLSDGIIEGNPSVRRRSQDEARSDAIEELWQQIIPELRRKGIRVYSLGLFKDAQGEETLKRIATETGGTYKKITNPTDFSKIYFDLLNMIEPPTREEDFSQGNKEININPGDRGIIVVGQEEFTVTTNESNIKIYPTDLPLTTTGIKVIPFKDSSGKTILYIGQPDEAGKNDEWKKGLKIYSPSNGKIYYISDWEFENVGDSLLRKLYFLNEIISLKFRYEVKRSLNEEAKNLLNNLIKSGTVEYTITNNNGGKVITGQLKHQDGDVFAEEQLLDIPGNFTIDINLKNDNALFKVYKNSFSVSEISAGAIKIFDRNGNEILENQSINVGDTITAEVITNPELITKYSGDYQGVALRKLFFFTEVKNSSNPIGVPFDDSQGKIGRFVSVPITVDSADLNLIAQLHDASLIQRIEGRYDTKQVPLRATIIKRIRSQNSWWAWVERNWKWIAGFGTILSIILGLGKVGKFLAALAVTKKELNHIILVPKRKGMDTEFIFKDIEDDAQRDKSFVYRTVGGATSEANIKVKRLNNDDIILKIGRTLNGENQIQLGDDADILVRVNGHPLQKDTRETFESGDLLSIGEDNLIEYIIKEEEPEIEDED